MSWQNVIASHCQMCRDSFWASWVYCRSSCNIHTKLSNLSSSEHLLQAHRMESA